MKLEEIYKPIAAELQRVESDLTRGVDDIDASFIGVVLGRFFQIPGKRLRPALTLLAAGAVDGKMPDRELLEKIGVAMELIHSASLVHDDIIDGALFRRGQKTLNRTYGIKIAALAGDSLFTRAFSILCRYFPAEYTRIMLQVTEKMCAAEIEQAKGDLSREKYLEVIQGKTASFTSACCQLGAKLCGAGESVIQNLAGYGLNFGMAYQIIDDFTDNDPNVAGAIRLEEALEYAVAARNHLAELPDSVYRNSLLRLVDFLALPAIRGGAAV